MPYGPRLSEQDLCSRIQQRIEDGRLPVALSKSLTAGYGSGDTCSGCSEAIFADHVEYELTDPRDGGQLTFHLSCHVIWQLKCMRRIARQKLSSGPKDVPGTLLAAS